MKIVDLRSDTVTRPTAAMREAMARAEVGDDVYGDDPNVNALQERIAALLGKEAALFVPSGTQSNLIAIMCHCGRGDEYIVGQMAHSYRWEGGGAAVLGSVQPQPLEHEPDGTLALQAIEAAIKPEDAHFARSRLLCLENTIGGRVLPAAYVVEATSLVRHRGLATHLDGARLFNAAVAMRETLHMAAGGVPAGPGGGIMRSGLGGRAGAADTQDKAGAADTQGAAGAADSAAATTSRAGRARHGGGTDPSDSGAITSAADVARTLVAPFDTVSVCFSKGLGAPIGSALVGSRDLIQRAHRWRKMLGGGMRQAGVVAAAARHALDHHVERLAEDHALARRLSDGLRGIPGVSVEPPQSNIVFADVPRDRAAGLLEHLKSRGVLAGGIYRPRFVTHLDVDAEGIDRAVAAVREHVEA